MSIIKSKRIKKIIDKLNETCNTDTIIKHVINSTIECKEPIIILEHYLILQKVKNNYDANYSDGFFNKLFLKLYLRFPRTILSLFIESPNYQFFRYFLGYIHEIIYNFNVDSHLFSDMLVRQNKKNKEKYIKEFLIKLYNLIILLFSIQLTKDFRIVKDNKYSEYDPPTISDAALYAPLKNDKFYSTIRIDIANKIFQNNNIKTCKCNSCFNDVKEYDNIIEILLFNITIFRTKKITKYIFENDIDLESAKKCCFKLFKKNFKLEY
jgi:hypothetical protein